jgi:hypothetical protein
MDFELISPQDYDNLPEDHEQCFVAFESICRRNMTRILDRKNSESLFTSVSGQYMASVYAVARECGITDIPFPPSGDDESYYSRYSTFLQSVQGEVARIRIRGRRARSYLTVQLTDNTRTKITWHVGRLRKVIDDSNLDTARKAALGKKLDELTEELEKRRISLGQVMAVLSGVLVGVASITTIGAEGPSAITNIMKLIGVDKDSEDAALCRLDLAPKALPAPLAPQPSEQPSFSASSWEPTSGDLDDEIPF